MRSPLTRRGALAGATSLFATLAGCSTFSAEEQRTDADGGSPSPGPTATDAPPAGIGTSLIADGFTAPVSVVCPSEDRYLVADQPGRIYLAAEGETETVLDLRDSVVDISGYDERGLLGIECHPGFADNGRLFVRYSAPSRSGTPESYSHTFVLSEFELDPETFAADPATERTILEIPEPQFNHNAGDLAFGPDGLLYVPVGDGGGANDEGPGHVADWYDPVPGGNGQDVTDNLLGSVLRIDVDHAGDGPYGIPPDNPLVGEAGLDEHYAWGLRNPWRLSFGPDGRLFVADVGQNRFEEVDVVERGDNYGWNVREGPACFRADGCPSVTPDGQPLRDPIVAYGRGDSPVSGIAVVGGYRYDGEAFPEFRGDYVFGDWQAEGRLFVAREADEGGWPTEAVSLASDEPGRFLLTFGRDPAGELLIGTTERASVAGQTGAVFRLTPA